jgi:hypothetical protein
VIHVCNRGDIFLIVMHIEMKEHLYVIEKLKNNHF